MNENEIIKKLYSTFKLYTTSDMHYCNCGCIDPKDVKKLASKPLFDLEENDFCSYHGSALFTWGNLDHYKHFLPRILEVYYQLKGKGIISLFEIAQKLEYAKWKNWDDKEIKVIKDFIFMDWDRFVNREIHEISYDDVISYAFFFESPELIKAWDTTINTIGLKNLVNFFYNNGIRIFYDEKTHNPQIKFEFHQVITESKLVEKLEEEFFRVEQKEQDYSVKVSFVLQLFERYNKLNVN